MIAKELNEKIVKLYQEGYSYGKIAEALSISKGTIPVVLKKLKVYDPNHKSTIRTNDNVNDSKIIDLYSQGYSCQHIGLKLNMSATGVRHRLLKNKIVLRQVKGIKHSLRKTTISLDYFKTLIETKKEDFDYFLGILATDGNVSKNQIRIGGIADNNVEFLQHWCNFLDNKVSIKKYKKSKSDILYNSVAFKNQDIVDLLSSQYGIIPNKTFTLSLPYLNWNVIRGIFDGDGSLSKDKRSFSFKFSIVTASITFANQLYDFFKSENLNVHLYTETGGKNPLYKVVIITISDIYYIFNHLYKDSSCFLKRKYDKFCPIVEKFTNSNSVNSVKEMENYKTEPSLKKEGAETRNGVPK